MRHARMPLVFLQAALLALAAQAGRPRTHLHGTALSRQRGRCTESSRPRADDHDPGLAAWGPWRVAVRHRRAEDAQSVDVQVKRYETLESVPGSKGSIDREGWPMMSGCWRLTGRRDQQQYPLFSNWDEAAIINGC